jgi:hypothetical protein
MAAGQVMSKKRKFVADGIFYAELNEFLTRELAEDNYSGVEVDILFFVRKKRTRKSSSGLSGWWEPPG